jgi:exo-1,4-beta-D-glucosaminidase
MSGPARYKLLLTSAVLAASALWGASAASADVTTLGGAGWQVQSSAQAPQSGGKISRSGFATGSWLQVHADDAGAPGTEAGALLQAGRCPNVFFAMNMKRCFGYMSQLGPDTVARFDVPWWFRTTFSSHLRHGQHSQLIINGVVGEADVWLNGRLVAPRSTVQGDYTRYTFDVTRLLRRGTNVLALRVYPNNPETMFTLDNVDWMQIPPDNNTGIQFPIQLHTSGPLGLSDVHVLQQDAPNLSRAALRIQGRVTNASGRTQSGIVGATVSIGGQGQGLGRSIKLPPHTTRTVTLRLVIPHPHVWWPYQMGTQPLYHLTMSVRQHGQAADSASETFGVRTITSRLVGTSPIAPHGSRQFLVNGRPFVFRGGGWSEDMFLRYSAANAATQIALIKNLGLNGIRTEGKQMPQDFYEQMDRAGLLIDGGFQCCDAWQIQNSKLTSNHDFRLLYNSARTIGENLRNHPSVMNFSWSDDNPTPHQERVQVRAFHQAGFQDPLISSAEYRTVPGLGPSGEKEGPYDWVPPSYWYSMRYNPHDHSRTNVGGAWAFDSEASVGDTVPTLDSIRGFMSPFEQTQLWQSPNYNQYHLNYEPGLPGPSNYGYSFGTLHDFDRALQARYGRWSSLSTYVEEAQVQDYETQRAEFEAYIAHSTRRRAPSTGIVYWQLNKGWPSLLWDLYNYDFDQAGSYFGAKQANQPLHALYSYDSGTVDVDNLGPSTENGLSVEADVYGLDGKLLGRSQRGGITLTSQGVATGVLHPSVPAATKPPARPRTYFIRLLLRQHGQVVDRNVYWLSTQHDLVDWSKTIGMPQATMTRFANLQALHRLRPAHIRVTAHTHPQPGPDGADMVTDVTITNTSHGPAVAFFLRADIRHGIASGGPSASAPEVRPAFWSDNDITLWPGESETLDVSYRRAGLAKGSPVVSVFGWNVAPVAIAAGG